ncbi:MAG: hypothetical protein R3B09_33715 [Nannocystaceae bacterium]
MDRRRLALTLLPLTLAACSAGHRVYHVSVAPDDAHGIYYALPRKTLSVDLEVSVHAEVRGACYEEHGLRASLGLEAPSAAAKKAPAKGVDDKKGKFLGIGESSASGGVTAPEPPRRWVTLSAAIREQVEVDPDEIYLIDVRGRRFESMTASVALTESGLLNAATITAENKAFDAIVAGVGAGLDLTAQAIGAVFAGEDRSSACSLYANRVREVRSQRLAIYGGTWGGLVGGLPRETLDRILIGLDRQEELLLRLFTAQVEVKRGVVTCAVTPKRADPAHGALGGAEQVFPLIQVDRGGAGVSPADPAVRCVIPEPLRAPSGANTAGMSTAYLTLKLRQDDLASQVTPLRGCKETREGRCAGPQGLFYRVPREASALVWWAPRETEELARLDLLVPQLGVTLALPANTGKIGSDEGILLYPGTGALRSLEGKTRTIDPTKIQDLAGHGKGVVDAIGSARAKDDELGRLERERTVLEEQVRIKEAREKLGEDPSDDGGRGTTDPSGGGGTGGTLDDRRPPGPGSAPPNRAGGGG